MNLYQRIVPLVVIFGILGSCTPNYSKFQKKREYQENKINLFDESCQSGYNEGPFFDNMLCDEDIFPRKNNDWYEDL